MTSRSLLARLTAPIAFATRRRTAKQLFTFALAEQESMLELRAAAARCASPGRAALYLRHALDEDRHATIFAAHAAEIRRAIGRPPWGHPRTGCEGLFERLGEIGFLAFVHLGEERGRAQFEVYARYFESRGAAGDDKLRAMFVALVGDERGHESYTRALLVELAGSEGAARKAIAKVLLWEALRGWRRAGQGLAQVVYVAAMSVVYLSLAPFAALLRVVRRTPRGWQEHDAGERRVS